MNATTATRTAPKTYGYKGNPATNTRADGQIAFANKLLAEVNEVNHEYALQVWAEFKATWATDTCTFALVSDRINGLLDAKKNAARSATEVNRPTVPSGRYAIDGTKADASTRYFRVVNENGHYTVFAYASDNQHPVRNYAAMMTVLREIEAAGIEAAAVRFGQESHRCYVCGRRLTRDHAKAAGIGDDCAERLANG